MYTLADGESCTSRILVGIDWDGAALVFLHVGTGHRQAQSSGIIHLEVQNSSRFVVLRSLGIQVGLEVDLGTPCFAPVSTKYASKAFSVQAVPGVSGRIRHR